jgi:hypothetical protein
MIPTCAFASLGQSNLPSLPSAGKQTRTEHEISLSMLEGTDKIPLEIVVSFK